MAEEIKTEEPKLNYDNKLKEWAKRVNLKYVLKTGVFFGGLLIVTICSVANIGLDFSKWDWQSWAGKSILITGIEIFGLLVGESIGGDRQKEQVNGKYQLKLKEHDLAVKRIEQIQSYLPQYLMKLTREELQNMKMQALYFVGIEQADLVIKLTLEELDQLHKRASNFYGEDLLKLNDDQYKVAVEVLNGLITIHCPNAAYFLIADRQITNKSYLEEGQEIDNEIKHNKILGRAGKILSSLAISVIWSLFTVNDFMDVASTEAWTNLISRIVALFTSFAAGYGSAIIDVKLRANKLEYKTKILTFLYNSYYILKDFNPKDIKQRAAEEVKKADEEEKKRKVDVELVDPVPQISQQPVINMGVTHNG